MLQGPFKNYVTLRGGVCKNVTKREGGVSMKRYVAKSVNKYIGKIGK